MKRTSLALALAVLISLAGCTEWLATVKSKGKSRRHRHRTKQLSTTPTPAPAEPPGVISGDQTGTLVAPGWIQKYQALEAKHGAIPADEKIYMEGEDYRIPPEVAAHFTDMVRADSAPKP